MEFKGTKGKWTSVKLEKTDYAPETNEIQFSDDGECVAEFVENDYDAQLIAHAPELLDFIKSIVEDYNNGLIDDVEDVAIRAESLYNKATTI